MSDKLKKIISKEEAIDIIKKDYSEDELEVIFAYHKGHPIEVIGNGQDKRDIRWEQTIDYDNDPNVTKPNEMVVKYMDGEVTQEEYMDYNRQIGYSIYGYWEVFCFNGRFDKLQYGLDIREKSLNKILDK